MLAENKCGGSISFVNLCAIGTGRKKRKEKIRGKRKNEEKRVEKM